MAKMETVSVSAYAKVNFTLDILGVRDGYHLLDSLVCTVDLCDEVTARRRPDGHVGVLMRGEGAGQISGRSNALRAAEAFCAAFGTGGAEIVIDRRIPVGAGLGSSSADAAGVLNALARLYSVTDTVRLKSIADALGSDTGYLLTGGWARIGGRGECVERIPGMPRLYLLLLCPASGVATAQCFAEYDRRGERLSPCTQRAAKRLPGEGAGAARFFANALTGAACALNGDIAGTLAQARELSPFGAGMTGSGSACYAVFDSEEACLRARERYAGNAAAVCVHTVE